MLEIVESSMSVVPTDKLMKFPAKTNNNDMNIQNLSQSNTTNYTTNKNGLINSVISTSNTIKNPITYDDIKLLANIKTNAAHVKLLKTKITSETIALARRNDSYYQIVSNLGKSMRNFHNWIKSNMIYTYCSKKTLMDNSKVAMDILDIGFGRGGDLMKFYHAKIKSGTASDINEAGIYSGSDGAISRYNAMRKKMPHFPKISFYI
jgi:hypothetical protein